MFIETQLNRQTAECTLPVILSHSSTRCHVPCLVPTPGMESTFQEYQSFSDSVVIREDSLPAYTRAKKRLEGYLSLENQLVRSNAVGF